MLLLWLENEAKKKNENPNKSEKEIETEVKEEIKRNTNKSREESIQKDYKINNEKAKELESIFKQIKLKINFDSEPKILRNGKFYTISKGSLFIYDNSSFNKLYEIKLENNCNCTSVIQSDNQDLILFSKKVLAIYRLKNNKYVQVQKINNNRAGYHEQRRFNHSKFFERRSCRLFR